VKSSLSILKSGFLILINISVIKIKSRAAGNKLGNLNKTNKTIAIKTIFFGSLSNIFLTLSLQKKNNKIDKKKINSIKIYNYLVQKT
jgi:hypothetical protein